MSRPAGSRDRVCNFVEQVCVRCAAIFQRKAKAVRQRWCAECAPIQNRERKQRENARAYARRTAA